MVVDGRDLVSGTREGKTIGEGRRKRLGWVSQGQRVGEGRETCRKLLQDLEASMGNEWHIVIYVAT